MSMDTESRAPIPVTEKAALAAIFERQRLRAVALGSSSARERIARLRALRASLHGFRSRVQEALFEDLRKSPESVDKTEILPVAIEASHAMRRLRRWMKPRRVGTPLHLAGTVAYVRLEPKGASLILAPWNYPVSLTLAPLVSAVAAGCTAVVKPSELTPATGSVLRELVADALPPEDAIVVEGDADVARALVALPFEHVHFTGSTRVGREVMRAAAERLATVTLELGGKSPTVVDESAPIGHVARVMAFSKFANCGQTCIAPDHVYVHEAVFDAFVDALRERVHAYFGADPGVRRASAAYGAIIDERHAERLRSAVREAILGGARVLVGDPDASGGRFVDALVLADVPAHCRLMEEEIFGPVLPVIRFRSLDEVCADIGRRPRPLSVYVFSRRRKSVERVVAGTTAGSTVVNDAMIQFVGPDLPFGGVGASGIGRAHGRSGFRSFSNERSVLEQRLRPGLLTLVYPPYTRWTRRVLALLRRIY